MTEQIPKHLSDADKELSREAQAKIEARPKLKVVDVLLADLEPAAWNPRTLSSKDKNDLKRSLDNFGCVEPLLVRKEDMSIIGGHQRYYVALELGWPDIPCVILDLTETQAKVLNVGLNKISGDWETDKLQELLAEIATEELEVDLTGFSDADMAAMGIYLDPTLAPEPTEPTKPETVPNIHCPKCGFEFSPAN